ncbi:uncharacterized protein BDZ99DRAFT_520877 [Mytilinidion resinicola]|uniref:Uncharacterized protein n=1 Tax=Mytilinidion resinicola TaxID=574789 RepID=A0A6A6YKX9_9PEZI|nr:uncharacterized protein BDZ99DRAFT_520877 [Mytilinidion resinicola]KAF2809526.1 hypothetical protein BDZ99DRAFT_520877 [Mytilinidion resinicola]
MFSPDSTINSQHGSVSRNPRRRQRKDSDSVRLQPHRKRNKLSEETFVSPSAVKVNGNGTAGMNGHASHGDGETTFVSMDMPVREKKITGKRAHKDDGSIVLTKSANYSVKKLPGFPTRLSQNPAVPYRAFILPSIGYALALTHEHALGWDYTSSSPPSKVHALPLSFGLKRSDPLPLGAIVQNGPSNEFGMVVVAPTTGKITFWENVDSAETFSRFPQRHQGVDGSVGKLLFGETVTEIVDIEHAGYALIFNSGRIAQLTLRDSQGRPSINVYQLQTIRSSGGLFGGLKNVLGGGIRKEVASVKARSSESKGQMEIVTATTTGLFQLWDLSWAGQQIFKREVDTHAEILTTLLGAVAPEQQGRQDVKVLDFAIIQHSTVGTEVSIADTRDKIDLLVLVAMWEPTSVDYSLLEVSLVGDTGVIRRVIPINAYQQPQLPKDPAAKLLLPLPGHTALIQFTDGIVMASLKQPEETPDTQLLVDTGKAPVPYQDTVYFRKDKHVRFAGSSLEEPTRKSHESSCVFVLGGFGIIRFACQPAVDDQTRVTARSKLEQATFFSNKTDQILDFSVRGRYNFPGREAEIAARRISQEVLTSSSEFVETGLSSMEEQLKKRSAALQNLASHLRSDYPPLPFLSRWELLQDAAKLAAALEVWKLHEVRVKLGEKHPDRYPSEPLTTQMVGYLHERYKTEMKTEIGERDEVRTYFIRDINHFELLVPWAFRVLKEAYNIGSKQHALLAQLISEADDFVLTTFETVFTFREQNLELYGLDPDCLDDGILRLGQGYGRIQGIWTSTHNIVQNTKQLVDTARTLSARFSDQSDTNVMKIAAENPRLVRISCQLHMELFRWSLEQTSEKVRATGQQLLHEFETKVRPELLFELTRIGQAAQGMDLAEKYRDMPTLVKIIKAERDFYAEEMDNPRFVMEAGKQMKKLQKRIAGYFTKYENDFAEAYYSNHIVNNEQSQVFSEDCLNQPALTTFLRADPARARLGWINEVVGEKNYVGAATMLTEVGSIQESNNWCKKMELSLAKLALLCAKQKGVSNPQLEKLKVQNEAELKLVAIQDKVYSHFYEIIMRALDEASAADLLMDDFGGLVVEQPALQQLLKQSFEEIIAHRVVEPLLLIDTLTLISQNPRGGSDDIAGSEFFMALQVLEICRPDLTQAAYEDTRKLIWKRCFVRDNWEALNDTTDKGDAEISRDIISTALGWTLRKVMESNSEWRGQAPAPSTVAGAGCSTETLASRFASEDLRNPIIKDNLVDEDKLQDYVTTCRLDTWFEAVVRATNEKMQVDMEVQKLQTVQMSMIKNGIEMRGLSEKAWAEIEAREASEAFEGDDEDSAGYEDTEMEDE